MTSSVPIKRLFAVSRKMIDPSSFSGVELFHYSLPAWHETGTGRIEKADDIASGKLVVQGGEILVSKLNPEKGAVIHAAGHEIPTICSPEFIALVPNTLDGRYAYYLMLSAPVRAQLGASVESVTNSHKRARVDRFLASRVSIPIQKTQKKIADFLDCETVRIDQSIERKQRLDAVLAAKRSAEISNLVSCGLGCATECAPSDSRWFDVLPRSWSLQKLVWLANDIGDGLHSTPEYDDSGKFYFINGNNLVGGAIELKQNTRRVNEREYQKYLIDLNDTTVLLSINGTIGNTARYHGEPVILGKSVAYINCSRRLNPQFLQLIFQAQQIRNYFAFEVTGTTISNLSLQSVRRTPIPTPPTLHEQRCIVEAAKGICEGIDRVRAKVATSIACMRELRAAVITAAVTGEIDVATWSKRGETDRRLARIQEDMATPRVAEQVVVRA